MPRMNSWKKLPNDLKDQQDEVFTARFNLSDYFGHEQS